MDCPKCQTDIPNDSRFCPACGHTIENASAVTDSGVRGAAQKTSKEIYARGKNSTTAMLLSIIPGLGQLYNGDVMKGVIMLVLLFTVISFPILVIWSILDAYQVAKGNWRLWKW